MIIIDALGKVCPMPVILMKKALRENAAKDDITIKVGNEVSCQNLTKLANQLKLKSQLTKISDSEYDLTFFAKGVTACTVIENPISIEGYVVVISGDTMGKGEEELGKKLIENFIYSLKEQDELPKKILFYNSGVKLVTQNEKTISDLKDIQDLGVEVLSCGLCLDYYGLKEKLSVGSVTNMYTILETMRTNHVVKP